MNRRENDEEISCGASSEGLKGLPLKIWGTLSQIVMDTPESLWEATWRLMSVFSIASLLMTSWIVWRHPEVVKNFIEGKEELEFVNAVGKNQSTKDRIFKELGTYVNKNNVRRIALVGWTGPARLQLIWASEETTKWPISTNGRIGVEMGPVLGKIIVEKCWVGMPKNTPEQAKTDQWVVCGINKGDRIGGLLIIQHRDEDNQEEKKAVARLLSDDLEDIINE